MSKEEMLRKLKNIHLLYSMPQLAQNMRPEHYAIVEYEKLAYEQQAIIDQLTNNWNELKEYIKDLPNNEYVGYLKSDILDKMKEIKERKNEKNKM